MAERRVEAAKAVTVRPSEILGPPPIGIPPVLRRFWDFTRDMAKRFSKHLMKNREEEFIKIVRKDLEKGI